MYELKRSLSDFMWFLVVICEVPHQIEVELVRTWRILIQDSKYNNF